MAEVRVKEADAHVIAEQGKAEAEAIREKMNAEAQGLAEKAESMKLLNEGTKEHEEFRLKLEKQVEIAKTEIGAQVDIAERNASILAMALKEANIDIVGGDGQFFDRFIKAVTFGKSLDAAHGKSSSAANRRQGLPERRTQRRRRCHRHPEFRQIRSRRDQGSHGRMADEENRLRRPRRGPSPTQEGQRTRLRRPEQLAHRR